MAPGPTGHRVIRQDLTTTTTTSQEDTMSKSVHPTKSQAVARFGRRQPRPAPRRQGTRAAVVAAAVREA